jgi:hypothetical protein
MRSACMNGDMAIYVSGACHQGMTHVHFSAQRKHFPWDVLGNLSDKTAQVKLRSGRVQAPACQIVRSSAWKPNGVSVRLYAPDTDP